MIRTQRALWIAGLGLAVMAAGGAQAQRYGPNGPPVAQYDPSQGGAYGPPADYGPPPPQSSGDVSRQIRQRLRLRPDQEGALTAFVQAVAPPPGMDKRMQDDEAASRTMSTPQRLDMMVSNMDEMRRLMLNRVQATKAFYAQLSPAQQRVFDALGTQNARGGGPGGGPGAYQGRPEPQGGPNAPPANGGLARD